LTRFTNDDVPKGEFLETLSGFGHFWVQICRQNIVK